MNVDSNRFSWQRFCCVVSKDFRNMWPLFGFTMLIIALIPTMIWILSATFSKNFTISPEARMTFIYFMFLLTAILTPSRMYRTINLRNEGIYYAMLPASRLEKWLSMILYTFFICPLIVFVSSLFLDIALSLLPFGPYRQWIWYSTAGFPLFSFGTLIGFSDYVVLFDISFLMGNIFFISIFLFTATLFKRHKVIFTFLWLFLIHFVLSIVTVPIAISLSQLPDFVEQFYDVMSKVDENLLWGLVLYLVPVVHACLAALLLFLTWRRLKRMLY